MKKVSLILAMAAVAAVPVFADNAKELQCVNIADLSTATVKTSVPSSVAFQKKIQKAPARISAVSDIYGQYEAKCFDTDGAQTVLSPTIKAGETSTAVNIYNFPPYDSTIPLPATVDVSKGTVTLRAKDTGDYNSNYGENMMIGPFKFVEREDGVYFQALESLECTISDDGTIVFPDADGYYTGVAIYISQGYFLLWSVVEMSPIEEWSFNASEWEDYGTGMFDEAIFNTYISVMGYDPYPEYEVSVMRNKTDKNQYLIVNPYKTDFWADFGNETPDADGYILLDATDPDCVLCQPLVFSGFSMPYSSDEDIQGIYVYNMEAMKYRSGYETIDIYYEYLANDEPVSNFDGEKFSIYNIYFGFTESLLSMYSWNDANGNAVEMLPSYLTLNNAGVEGVEVDNSNAPVKYYNLQGVEVANPEKGQLVIKKQGSKVEKFIVR